MTLNAPIDPRTLIDPEIAACIARTAHLPVSDIAVMSPGDARATYAAGREPWNVGGPAMAETRHGILATSSGKVPMVELVPERAEPGVVIYLHGGGWVTGGIATHDGIMRMIASSCSTRVIGLDYPLAPEARRSRIVASCLQGVCQIAERGEPMVIAGDSAGGELALAVAMQLRDDDGPLPAGLGLLYPALWPRFSSTAHRRCGNGEFGLTTAKMQAFWRHYLGPEDAPLADTPDLSGLPPSFVLGAALDCLLDDALDLSRLLAHGNVTHELVVPAGSVHGFLHYSAGAAVARDTHRRFAAFARARLSASRT